MSARVDVHRPGAIVPADYDYVLSYSTPGGPYSPAYNIDCENQVRWVERPTPAGPAFVPERLSVPHRPDGRCCVIGLHEVAQLRFVETGGTGKCSVCGANYRYGDVWQHRPTGALIHVGHDCADKYALLADRSAWELAHDRAVQAKAVMIQRDANRDAREAFLTAHPGLAEILALDHPILRDMAAKLAHFRSLSDKQIAFAEKLAGEVRSPKAEDRHVAAPLGAGILVRGTLVSLKSQESQFGTTMRMTVKVETPDGAWLCWGTAPAGLLDARPDRGDTGEFTANLVAGRDAYFAIAKRPRKAAVLARAGEPLPAGPIHVAGANVPARCGATGPGLRVGSAGEATCAECLLRHAAFVGGVMEVRL